MINIGKLDAQQMHSLNTKHNRHARDNRSDSIHAFLIKKIKNSS